MPKSLTALRGHYPVAMRVAHILEERIARGDYAAGAWLPTERALATEFEVDRSQIRAALGHLEGKSLIVRAPGHRPVVSDRRRFAADGSRTPDARRAVTIAAVLPQHPVYPAAASILKGIQQELRQAPVRANLMFFDTHAPGVENIIAQERQALSVLVDEGIAGGILWPTITTETTAAQVRELQRSGRPIVYVDRYPEDMLCDFVGVDNRLSAIEAVEYLLRLGHRRIGHLTNTDQASPVSARATGYREALARAGIPYDPNLVFSVPVGTPPDGAEPVRHFRALPDPPTAVFAMNDSLAHALIQAWEAGGLSVPGDLSVIGFDDLERFSPHAALLTTMHQPFQRIGQHAAELLLERLQERQNEDATAEGDHTTPVIDSAFVGRHILLPTPLVERATCAPPHRP